MHLSPVLRPRFTGALERHQNDGVKWLLSHPKAVLADDVGLGKTVTALAYVSMLDTLGCLRPPPPGTRARVLWLTESALIGQAADEVGRFLPSYTVLTPDSPELRGSARARRLLAENFPDGADVLIYGHDLARSRIRELAAERYSLLVVDEASIVKGAGQTASAITQLARATPRVLGMTATPLENDPTELYSLLSATDCPGLWTPECFEQLVAWDAYTDNYGRTTRKPIGWRPGAAAQVAAYWPRVMLRRTTEQLGMPLPTCEQRTLWVPLTAAQRSAYARAAKARDLGGFYRQQRAGRTAAGHSPIVSKLLTLLGTDPGQAVVFSEYLEMVELIADGLTAQGITFRRMDGDTDEADRRSAVEHFRSGAVRVLLGTKVLERGLNLQNARRLISVDSSWNPARERQREGRLRRIGSPHATVEHITLKPDTPLSRKSVQALQRKSGIAEAIGL